MYSSGHFKKTKEALLARIAAAYIALAVVFLQALPLESVHAEETAEESQSAAEPVETHEADDEEVNEDEAEETDEGNSETPEETAENPSEDEDAAGSAPAETDDQDADETGEGEAEEDGASGSGSLGGESENDENIPSDTVSSSETVASSTDDEPANDNDGQDMETSTSTGSQIATTTAHDNATSVPPPETGADSAASSSSATSTEISTGNAGSASWIVNEANVNGVNSTGTVAIVNDTTGADYTLDLRDLISSSSTSTLPCAECGEITITPIEINGSNNATITNDITTEANTGDNSATSSNAYIVTGDAAAITNLVNLANMNVINSEILLLILNKEGDWNGALIMPNGDFFTQFFNGTGGIGGEGAPPGIESSNEATVENIVNTDATSGKASRYGYVRMFESGPKGLKRAILTTRCSKTSATLVWPYLNCTDILSFGPMDRLNVQVPIKITTCFKERQYLFNAKTRLSAGLRDVRFLLHTLRRFDHAHPVPFRVDE